MHYEMLGSGITGTVPKVHIIINGWAFGMSTPMNTGFPASECVDGNVDLNFLVAARVMANGAPDWQNAKEVSEWDWQGTVLYDRDESHESIAQQNKFTADLVAMLTGITRAADRIQDTPTTRWTGSASRTGFRSFP